MLHDLLNEVIPIQSQIDNQALLPVDKRRFLVLDMFEQQAKAVFEKIKIH